MTTPHMSHDDVSGHREVSENLRPEGLLTRIHYLDSKVVWIHFYSTKTQSERDNR